MKTYVAMMAHNLKVQYSELASKFSRNSEKFEKLQGERLKCIFNPFQSGVTFLYPLKTLENLWFFRGYRNCHTGLKWVNKLAAMQYRHEIPLRANLRQRDFIIFYQQLFQVGTCLKKLLHKIILTELRDNLVLKL